MGRIGLWVLAAVFASSIAVRVGVLTASVAPVRRRGRTRVHPLQYIQHDETAWVLTTAPRRKDAA